MWEPAAAGCGAERRLKATQTNRRRVRIDLTKREARSFGRAQQLQFAFAFGAGCRR